MKPRPNIFHPFAIPITFLLSSTFLWRSCEPVGIYADGSNFCYDDNDPTCDGPSEWGGFCNSKYSERQTPITLPNSVTTSPYPVPRAIDLNLDNYHADNFRMQNNGHTIVVQFPRSTNTPPPVSLGRWDGFDHTEYKLDSAHFHWGLNDSVGSEHCFEHGCYSMELHLVHYKNNFDSVSAAINSQDPNTLAVIGIMFNALDGGGSEANPNLAPIIDNLKQVDEPSHHGEWTDVDTPLDFRPFLSSLPGQSNVYTYKGSLTTPECNEKVNWYVFDRPFPVSPEDVERFRNVYDYRNELMTQNHRPLQNRHKREIYFAMVRQV